MDNPQTTILKPCPFCGGTPTTETLPPIKATGRSGNRYHVWCMSCFALMDSVASIEDAADAWNKRTHNAIMGAVEIRPEFYAEAD